MNCKFCEAELPEGMTLCHACGKENADEVIVEEFSAEEMEQEAVLLTEEELTEEALAAAEGFEEESTEEAAPKKKVWKIVTAVICIVLVLSVLAGAVLFGTGAFNKTVTYSICNCRRTCVSFFTATKNTCVSAFKCKSRRIRSNVRSAFINNSNNTDCRCHFIYFKSVVTSKA